MIRYIQLPVFYFLFFRRWLWYVGWREIQKARRSKMGSETCKIWRSGVFFLDSRVILEDQVGRPLLSWVVLIASSCPVHQRTVLTAWVLYYHV